MSAAGRAAALLAWYAAVRRPLPWRFTRDPYALLVSEVMLQQTQAARVVPYWEAWIARWPEPASLAAAPARDVLRAWSGLGYNRRAPALQRAAAVVARDGWPDDLETLPGVGAYTAAAVASFAWDAPIPAVDTNARRVLGRWAGVDLALPGARAAAAPEQAAAGDPAAWNQAMMELGATVCRARAADCYACPVAAWGASAGRVEVPARAAPRSRKRFEDTDRWARGRVVAAVLDGGPLPELEPGRRARVLAGLERDGLIRIGSGGRPEAPAGAPGGARHDSPVAPAAPTGGATSR